MGKGGIECPRVNWDCQKVSIPGTMTFKLHLFCNLHSSRFYHPLQPNNGIAKLYSLNPKIIHEQFDIIKSLCLIHNLMLRQYQIGSISMLKESIAHQSQYHMLLVDIYVFNIDFERKEKKMSSQTYSAQTIVIVITFGVGPLALIKLVYYCICLIHMLLIQT